MPDDLEQLRRRLARVERVQARLVEVAGLDAEFEADEELLRLRNEERLVERNRRMSDATRAAHEVNQQRP